MYEYMNVALGRNNDYIEIYLNDFITARPFLISSFHTLNGQI